MTNVLEIPVGLGIIRKNLPQIVSSEVRNFVDYLKDNDVLVRARTRVPGELKPSQKDLNVDKIKDMAKKPELLKKPVFCAGDDYLLDGHHTWGSHLLNKSSEIRCIEANCSIHDLIRLGREFEGSKFKSVHEQLTRKIFDECATVFG